MSAKPSLVIQLKTVCWPNVENRVVTKWNIFSTSAFLIIKKVVLVISDFKHTHTHTLTIWKLLTYVKARNLLFRGKTFKLVLTAKEEDTACLFFYLYGYTVNITFVPVPSFWRAVYIVDDARKGRRINCLSW